MSRPKNKPLGPAFHGYLRICEGIEAFMTQRTSTQFVASPDRIGHFMGFVLSEMHKVSGKDHIAIKGLMDELFIRWATDATVIREAFKFQGDFTDLIRLHREWLDGREWNDETSELLGRPPFDNCMFMVHNIPLEAGDYILDKAHADLAEIVPFWRDAALLIEERVMTLEDEGKVSWDTTTRDDWYARCMKPGEKFWSVTMYLRDAMSTGYSGIMPYEIHYNPHNVGDWILAVADMPEGVDDLYETWGAFSEVQHTLFVTFLGALQSRQRQDHVTVGRKPGMKIRMPKKGRERIFYEHTTVTINPNAELPEHSDVPVPYTPRRQHPVRGFVRHYKRPLKSGPNKGKTWTWVEPHHRGDKELGVITHDYEVTTEDETDE